MVSRWWHSDVIDNQLTQFDLIWFRYVAGPSTHRSWVCIVSTIYVLGTLFRTFLKAARILPTFRRRLKHFYFSFNYSTLSTFDVSLLSCVGIQLFIQVCHVWSHTHAFQAGHTSLGDIWRAYMNHRSANYCNNITLPLCVQTEQWQINLRVTCFHSPWLT